MSEKRIVPTLGNSLAELEITKNRLSVESKVRPATINDLVNGTAKAIQFDTLTNILNALNRIAIENGYSKTYLIDDVFKYIPDEE